MARLSFKDLRSRLRDSVSHRKDIDIILSQIPDSTAPLRLRTFWFFDLVDWIRREGKSKHDLDFTTGAPQAARVRYLLQILERNLKWKQRAAKTLRSIIKDTKGLDLFIEIGLFSQDHFLGEFLGRLNEKWIPEAPRDHELSYIFRQNFHYQADYEWIHLLDDASFKKILDLFHFEISTEEENWNSLAADAEQALLLLALQVQGLGLSADLRKRLADSHFEKSPFYQLPEFVEHFITEPSEEARQTLKQNILVKIRDCQKALIEVQNFLDQHGVSIQVVYKIERLEHLLKRIQDLLLLLSSNPVQPKMLSIFIEKMIAENVNKRSLYSFFSQIFSLLSRKIVERNGETGEHYITRTPAEHIALVKSAIGGGIITAFTAIIRFLLYHLQVGGFFAGVLASLNYSISFMAIHFCHFTLGTKQPSSTAPALAARMHAVDDPESLTALTSEIIHTIRSQFTAILGNVIGVVPTTLLICWLYDLTFSAPILSNAESHKVMESFSILGITPFYAAFTGILLWLSSLSAGWVENWFTYHQISTALAANRRLIFIFGPKRAKTFSLFLRRNIIGISSSISLGFLLGLTPTLFQFVGIHLEVRHVTLSSGGLATAIYSQQVTVLQSSEFWFALAGVISMGILNVVVAFSLALLLAIKARQVKAPKRKLIYRAVLKNLYNNPSRLLWPRNT